MGYSKKGYQNAQKWLEQRNVCRGKKWAQSRMFSGFTDAM